MRKGLHPLLVHLGMAAASAEPIRAYAAQFKPSFTQEQLVEMVRGIKLYQAHSFEPQRLALDIVWSSGATRILKSKNTSIKTQTKPLLLVPSLINKSYILDLSEQRSLLRWFNENGIATYLLDWGDLPSDEISEDVTLGTLVTERLVDAIRHISELHDQPIDLLGYCMGGTLLVPAYHFASEQINKMVFLATPWDFHARANDNKSNELARSVRIWSPIVLPAIKDKGIMPSQYIQALFASLGSAGSVQKFGNFAAMDQNSEEAKFFITVEDWLNDDVHIPGQVAVECIERWFIKNEPAKGDWVIEGTAIDPKNIKSKTMVVASKKDRLVPYNCALALHDQLSAQSKLLDVSAGHIGMIVGKNSVSSVWREMLNWLKS